jgi:hypothetical protein
MTWPAWVLVICAVASLVCVLYGVVRAAMAARVVKAHADRLKTAPLVTDAARAQTYVARINEDMAGIQALLERAQAAIAQINRGLADLRIPEAVAAVRTAGLAIRLLLNHR